MNFVALIFFVLCSLVGCSFSESQELPAPTPKQQHSGCYSKSSGSTPACWTEADWKVFCERVQCKELSQSPSIGDNMKKGFYWIITSEQDNDGNSVWVPALSEGTYEYHGKLFIHRSKDYKYCSNRWKVSHVDSGACMAARRTLKEARRIAKEAKDFALWNNKSYGELTEAIKDPANEEEVNQIKAIALL